jgi:alkane 1-monooxygenase
VPRGGEENKMTSASMAAPMSRLALFEIGRIWGHHLLSLLIPLTALAFLWTGPHPWYVAPLFIAPLAVFHYIDTLPRVEKRQPVDSLPAWPFDLLVYALTGLHFLILYQMAVMFSQQQIFSLDMVMVFVLVGGNSGFSIITAHELIHRKKGWEQQLGRLLLCTVLYEHFYTEHLRGHHARVGTPEDPATARFGETFRSFWRRTVPAQFRSAWRLEAKRLGDADMKLLDPRMSGNRILHGLAVGWGIAFLVWAAFGPVAFAAYVLQAFVAVRLLEAVNYFEHWGLSRSGRRVRPVDSWDTHSWFTYYGLVGLSRHADHHAYPSRPYQQLRVWDQAPVLPVGYVALVDMVIARNDEFRAMATAELRRRQLGPFAPGPDGQVSEPAEPEAPRRSGLRGWLAARWSALPAIARPLLFWLGVVLAAALGVSLESGGRLDYAAALVQGLVILAVFVGVLGARFLIERVVHNGWVSWGCAFALLFIVGRSLAPYL